MRSEIFQTLRGFASVDFRIESSAVNERMKKFKKNFAMALFVMLSEAESDRKISAQIIPSFIRPASLIIF